MNNQTDYTEQVIEFNTSRNSSVMGRLIRLIAFPFMWVLTGRGIL
jgi:hypothetical protein